MGGNPVGFAAKIWKIFVAAAMCVAVVPVFAQGKDSIPAERDILIIAEMLPGTYSNVNQAYFDGRRKLPETERHADIETTITRVTAPNFGDYAFLWTNTVTGKSGEANRSYRIAALSVDHARNRVVMKHYFSFDKPLDPQKIGKLKPSALQRTDGCDYYFTRRAGHYHGAQLPQACRFQWQGDAVYVNNFIQLSPNELWFVDDKYLANNQPQATVTDEPYRLERVRQFHCYIDVPGVGGGRDIPFKRYDNIQLHDHGGTHWFETEDGSKRNVGVSLRLVNWPILNEKGTGNFNRNSLVLYTMEKLADGTVESRGYTFTQPDAERIGLNLSWMLVNCSMTPRDKAVPVFE